MGGLNGGAAPVATVGDGEIDGGAVGDDGEDSLRAGNAVTGAHAVTRNSTPAARPNPRMRTTAR